MKKYEIHTLGNQFDVYSEVLQDELKLNERDMYNELTTEFSDVVDALQKNNISYKDLKTGLIPPDGKNKSDFYFIFDISKIDDRFYGRVIVEQLFKILTNRDFSKSNNSIFIGDLLYSNVVTEYIINDIEQQLDVDLQQRNTDYCVVLISNLSKYQKDIIDTEFRTKSFYVGAVDWTIQSPFFKSGLMLPSLVLKNKENMILSSVEPRFVSIWEEYIPTVFKVVYIPDYLFARFLTYNYFSTIYDVNKDFSLNFINPDEASEISSYSVLVEDDKFQYMQKNKQHVLSALNVTTLEDFVLTIKQSLSNCIFNIVLNEYVLKFNTLINSQSSRFCFSFEYEIDKKQIRLITAY